VDVGVAVPTCKEGLSLPTPFCSPAEVLAVCTLAERLGYHSVWGNDHLTPPRYVRDDYPEPPNFYEPLTVLAFAAQATSRIRLGTSVLVLPMREPVYLAKTIATLDAFSGGRFMLGVGVGSYREEFERLAPRRASITRAELMDEALQSLRLLFEERTASFAGTHVAFDGISLAPKPTQRPLPFFVAGNAVAGARRAARWGQAWFPAAIGQAGLARGRTAIEAECARFGRDPAEVLIAPQLTVGIGRTHEAGVAQFRRSRMYTHLQTLAASTLRGQDLSQMEVDNLVGSPAEIAERIDRLARAGVGMLPALSFTSNSYAELLDDMALFAAEVLPLVRALQPSPVGR
jgi:probable F420-dependent oxidoreductase